jgi:FxsC-like protein
MAPRFFLSYARQDVSFENRLYKDLVNEVAGQSGWPIDEIGFRDDTNIEVGQKWSRELGRALHSCKLFVYLQSPTYFTREWCGKEWYVFESRLEAVRTSGKLPDRPALMLPILWWPCQELPAVAASNQYAHRELGEVYAKEGLHYLMRLKKHRDDYEEFKVRFARRIISAIKSHDLAESAGEPDFAAAGNAFVPPAASAGPPPAPTSGPRYATFVFVVGQGVEMQKYKTELKPYGDGRELDWKPFCPPEDNYVTLLAQKAALKENLNYEKLSISDNLLQELQEAEEKRKLIVILVDTWTLQLDRYRKIMEQYDARRFRSCVVLVPWNSQDPDFKTREAELNGVLRRTFSRQQSGPTYRTGITSAEKLEEEISAALVASRKQILELLEPVREIPAEGAQSLPIVNAIRSA